MNDWMGWGTHPPVCHESWNWSDVMRNAPMILASSELKR